MINYYILFYLIILIILIILILFFALYRKKEGMELKSLINDTDTDKNTTHSYLDTYEKLLHKKKETATNVLEVGIGDFREKNGGSIILWSKYFLNATIYAIDILEKERVLDELINNKSIILFTESDAYSEEFFNKNILEKKIKFDFLLDDGPHTIETMIQFIHLYTQVMKDDGILAIEDVKSLEWVEILKNETPEFLKKYIEVYDLRVHDLKKNANNDDIIFVINRS